MFVLAGKNNIAVNAFLHAYEKLGNNFAVVCNKTDTGSDGWQRSLKKIAYEKNVPILTLSQAYRVASTFVSLEFDLLVSPEKFRNAKLYNIHFSHLPKYKGMYTSVWPLLNGEKSSAVTLHAIDSGIDTGELYDVIKFPIMSDDRARDLYDKYLTAGYELFVKNFKNFIENNLVGYPQTSLGSSYFSKSSIDFHNLRIDLSKTAEQIKQQIFAYSFREYQLPKVFDKKIANCRITNNRSIKRPGQIVLENETFVRVSSIDFDIDLFFDQITNIHRFSSCSVSEAQSILSGLCGPNDRNENGWSPIIIAAYNGNLEVVKYLLQIGAKSDDVNYKGTSVLMYAKDYAIASKDKSIFDLLIKRGVNKNQSDFSGLTIFDYLDPNDRQFLSI